MIRKGDRLYPYVGCCIDCLNNATEIIYDGRLRVAYADIYCPQVLVDGIATDEWILNWFRKEPNLGSNTVVLTIRDFKINKGDKLYLIDAGPNWVRINDHHVPNGTEVEITSIHGVGQEIRFNGDSNSWIISRFSDRPNGQPLTKEDINLESFGIEEIKETKVVNSAQLIIMD